MYEAEGKLIALFPEQTGNGKNGTWTKRDFVIETTEQYPKKLYFSAWGDKGDFLKQAETGMYLKVVFFAESREYNSRWYTDLKVWKIDSPGNKQAQSENGSSEKFDNFDEIPEDPSDILPF